MSILDEDRSLFVDPKDYAGPLYVSLIDDIARCCGRPIIIRCWRFTHCATDRERACSGCVGRMYNIGLAGCPICGSSPMLYLPLPESLISFKTAYFDRLTVTACGECGSFIYGCGIGDVFALSVSQYVEQDTDII